MRPERYDVIQGAAAVVTVTLRDDDGNAITDYAGTEPLAATLATPGNGTQLAAPTAAWLDHTAGTVKITVAAATTAALAPGDYTVTLTLDDAGTVVWPYQCTVAVLPAAVDTSAPSAPGSQPSSSAPSRLTTVYATDEDVACRAPWDFVRLCPAYVRLAAGTDGLFTAGNSWAFQSESVNFATAGVAPGHVVSLTFPRSVATAPGDNLFGVDAVSGQTLWLRRLGLASGVGQPPANGAAVSGVKFELRTYKDAIDRASYEANKFFGIDPNVPVKAPSRLYDSRELQQFVVLTVLRHAYIAAEVTATGDYKLKLADVSAELEDLKSRLTLHWGNLALGQPPNSVFSARTRR